jgi:Phage portal protein, lambda family
MTKQGVLRGAMTGARRRIGALIGGFEAGLSGRRLRKFQASRAHVNSLIGAAGPTIYARARWLVRNNGYALNALESWAGNAVGDGVKPTSKLADAAQKMAIQALWQDWVAEADAEELTDFYGLQRRAARELFLTGEVFFRFRPRLPQDGLSVPLQLQMLPSEMLPITHNKELPGGGMIRHGIEFDLIGRRAAYYFLRRHPGDATDPRMAGEIVRVPANEVIHVIDPVEAGQTIVQPPAPAPIASALPIMGGPNLPSGMTLDSIRAEAAEIAKIGAEAAKLGLTIDVPAALTAGTKPDALRRAVLEQLAATTDATIIASIAPRAEDVAPKESPLIAAAEAAAKSA